MGTGGRGGTAERRGDGGVRRGRRVVPRTVGHGRPIVPIIGGPPKRRARFTGPPGEAWPIDSPEVPPEKRPSVNKAQDVPRPLDLM